MFIKLFIVLLFSLNLFGFENNNFREIEVKVEVSKEFNIDNNKLRVYVLGEKYKIDKDKFFKINVFKDISTVVYISINDKIYLQSTILLNEKKSIININSTVISLMFNDFDAYIEPMNEQIEMKKIISDNIEGLNKSYHKLLNNEDQDLFNLMSLRNFHKFFEKERKMIEKKLLSVG